MAGHFIYLFILGGMGGLLGEPKQNHRFNQGSPIYTQKRSWEVGVDAVSMGLLTLAVEKGA